MDRPNSEKRVPIDCIGQTYGKWTIIKWAGTGKWGRHYYLCRCACGRERPVRLDSLKRGQTKSCGCSQFDRFSHLHKGEEQYCPRCEKWLPLLAYSKYYQGKIGEPCRECRKARNIKLAANISPIERRERYLRSKYDISYHDFISMAERQQYRCLGCQKRFEWKGLCVDHDHNTGTIRGLLCSQCNSILGLIKDDEQNLYRLSAYLTRDPSKIFVYVTGSLRNKKVIEIANVLRRQDNLDIFDDYMAAGPEADDFWKQYENARNRSYEEALDGRAAKHVFYYDRSYIDLSDILLVVLPAGKSCMLEAGYAKARGKLVFFLLDEDAESTRYDVMKRFADGLVKSEEEFLYKVHELFPFSGIDGVEDACKEEPIVALKDLSRLSVET